MRSLCEVASMALLGLLDCTGGILPRGNTQCFTGQQGQLPAGRVSHFSTGLLATAILKHCLNTL